MGRKPRPSAPVEGILRSGQTIVFRIKKLDIFITKQFGLLFVGTFFICLFVLMMQFLWRFVDDLIGKGLSMDVLAQFFWYMALMLVPQAFPLAILLSSLITFGNLGESSELTAIKAAGISLLQTMRSLIVVVILIAGLSFYFQDVIGPNANKQFAQLLLSMKQKSPELEIPEGIFYDGIPNSNLYVQKKDMETGKLYNVMIYRQSGSYEDQAIILADSGMLQSTADKGHLLLTLWSGEWFENMRSQDMGGTAEVPYRRETFYHKQILLDFDGGFNLADGTGIAGSAKAKSVEQILHDLDSIRLYNDSVGREFYQEAKAYTFHEPMLTAEDSVRLQEARAEGLPMLDSLFDALNDDQMREVTKNAARQAQNALSDLEMKADYAKYLHRQERTHMLEAIGKFTLALSCIIFFFIEHRWAPSSARADWGCRSSSRCWCSSSITSLNTRERRWPSLTTGRYGWGRSSRPWCWRLWPCSSPIRPIRTRPCSTSMPTGWWSCGCWGSGSDATLQERRLSLTNLCIRLMPTNWRPSMSTLNATPTSTACCTGLIPSRCSSGRATTSAYRKSTSVWRRSSMIWPTHAIM